MAETFHKTPYELLDEDGVVAFSFNRTIFLLGNRVDKLLDEKVEVESFGKKEWRRRYSLEEALELASADPTKPKLDGLAAIFQSLRPGD